MIQRRRPGRARISNQVTTFPDWKQPVTRLRVEHGPPAREHEQLADDLGLKLRGDEARPIVAAMLRDALAGPLELRPFEPASRRQYRYLRELTGGRLPTGLPPDPSYMLVSAWIRHLLALSTIDALECLELRRGDLVLFERRIWDPFADRDD